jgi:hypothetical protein
LAKPVVRSTGSPRTTAHLDGVVEPDQRRRGAVPLGEVGEDPLAAQAAHRVLADRIDRGVLAAAARGDRHQRVHVAGGQRDEP